jgi:hypothetical protein
MALPSNVDDETRKRLQLIASIISQYGYMPPSEMQPELLETHGINRSQTEMRADYRALGLE